MGNGKTALVTGASMGLGKELADLLATDGHDLILVARSRDKLDALSQELQTAHGIKAHVITSDLTKVGAPEELAQAVATQGLQVDILVNNAGFGSTGAFASLPRQRELDMIQLNVHALVNLTHLFLSGMIQRGFGRVLNIASTAGFQPGPGMSVYYATKAFVISFTEGIAHELRGSGVTATAHCPGATATEFAGTAGNDTSPLFKSGSVADARTVARHAYRSMQKGRVLPIFGLLNRIAAFSVRLSPRFVVRRLAAWLNKAA